MRETDYDKKEISKKIDKKEQKKYKQEKPA